MDTFTTLAQVYGMVGGSIIGINALELGFRTYDRKNAVWRFRTYRALSNRAFKLARVLNAAKNEAGEQIQHDE